MARRMYDLDNGTEDIKVKDITCNKITAVTSAITTEHDDLVVNGKLTVKGGGSSDNITIGSSSGGNPDYIKSDANFDLISNDSVVLSITTSGAIAGLRFQFKNYETAGRPSPYPSTGAGSVIYDSDLAKLILWNGTAWVNLDGTSGGFVRFPSYSSAERPTLSGQVGAVIYDSTLGKLILWNDTAWVNLDGSSLGE